MNENANLNVVFPIVSGLVFFQIYFLKLSNIFVPSVGNWVYWLYVVLQGGVYSPIIWDSFRIRVKCNKRFFLGKQLGWPYILCMTLSIPSGDSNSWCFWFNHSMATQNVRKRRRKPLIWQSGNVYQKMAFELLLKEIWISIVIYKQLLRCQFPSQCYILSYPVVFQHFLFLSDGLTINWTSWHRSILEGNNLEFCNNFPEV